MKVRISPSMMCADLLNLKETLRIFEQEQIELLHLDIMDGHFVPNYMLGTDFVKQLRRASSIPFDLHLMVEDPERVLSWFEPREGDLVSVHVESTRHLQRALSEIKGYGACPVAAVNPATPICALEEVIEDIDGILVMTVNPGFAGQKLVPQTLEKIHRLRCLLDSRGKSDAFLEVDGNVSLENAVKMRKAGADTFVAGTSCLFRGENLAEKIHLFRQTVK